MPSYTDITPPVTRAIQVWPGDTPPTREVLLDRIEAEGMVLVAEHFPEPGFGHVVRAEGKRFFQAL